MDGGSSVSEGVWKVVVVHELSCANEDMRERGVIEVQVETRETQEKCLKQPCNGNADENERG